MRTKRIKPDKLIWEIKKVKARLITITAMEDKGKFILLYQFDGKELMNIEIALPKKNPVVGSIIRIYPSATLYECEIHDLFGIEFEGNPNLEHNLFLEDHWKGGPPLSAAGKNA